MTRILDADRHVMEPMSLWAEFLPADLRARAPYLVDPRPDGSFEERVQRYGPKALFPLRPTLMFDGEPAWSRMSQRAQVELSWSAHQRRAEVTAASHPEGQLASMTRFGIHAAFLYPTLSLYLLGMDTLRPGDGAALAAAYNDWLRQYCSHDPRRLRGVGLLSSHDPESMAAEAARVAGFGWTAVSLLPNQIRGRGLSHPAYEPLWATCERLSLAVEIHAATHTRLPAAGAGRFESHFALHACAHPMEQMMAFLALVEGGVLERHPALRVGFFESGCGISDLLRETARVPDLGARLKRMLTSAGFDGITCTIKSDLHSEPTELAVLAAHVQALLEARAGVLDRATVAAIVERTRLWPADPGALGVVSWIEYVAWKR